MFVIFVIFGQIISGFEMLIHAYTQAFKLIYNEINNLKHRWYYNKRGRATWYLPFFYFISRRLARLFIMAIIFDLLTCKCNSSAYICNIVRQQSTYISFEKYNLNTAPRQYLWQDFKERWIQYLLCLARGWPYKYTTPTDRFAIIALSLAYGWQ